MERSTPHTLGVDMVYSILFPMWWWNLNTVFFNNIEFVNKQECYDLTAYYLKYWMMNQLYGKWIDLAVLFILSNMSVENIILPDFSADIAIHGL